MNGVFALVRAAVNRRRVPQFLLEVLVVALASAGIASAASVRTSQADRVDAAFTAAQGPDLVVWTERRAAADVVALLAGDSRVSSVAEPVAVGAAHVPIGDGADPVAAQLRSSNQANGDVNRPVLSDGRWPQSFDEIVLDTGFADDHDVGVGASLTFVAGGSTVEAVVVGVAHDFTDCFYPSCDPIRIWVDPSMLADADEVIVAATVDEPGAAAAVDSSLQDALGSAYRGANTWPDTRADLLVEAELFGVFLSTFGAFVLLASAVVIAGSITARVAAQRRTYALYKAIGYTPGQIAAAAVLEHLAIAVGAAVVGSIGAFVLAPHLQVGALGILDGRSFAWSTSGMVIAVAATAVIVVVATLVPAVRSGRTPVVAALGGSTVTQHLAATKGLRVSGSSTALPARLGVHGALARPLRTSLAAGAVAIAVIAALVSASILRSVGHVLDNPELSGDPAAISISFDDPAALDDIDVAAFAEPMVASWYTLADARASADGEPLHARVLAGDPGAPRYVIGEGRLATADGEAIAGYGLLEERGWKLSDTVELTIGDATDTVTLVGWYRETEDGGEILQARSAVLEDAVPPVDYRAEINLVPGADARAVAERLSETLARRAEMSGRTPPQVRVNETSGEQSAPLAAALVVLAGLVGVVVAAHVLASVVTTARERRHRTAILRSLGLGPRDVLLESGLHGATIGLLGVAVGVPLGLFTQRILGDALTSSIGAGPGLTLGPSGTQVLAVAVVAAYVSIGLACLAARSSATKPIPLLLTTAE